MLLAISGRALFKALPTDVADWRLRFSRQKNKPSIGDDAEAKRFLGMRPARKASRPASMPFLIADAINTGFLAAAMAVFINTPSQPSSIAIAASDAVPTPASTRMGTLAFSTIVRIL